jgi:hypothetical protein
LERLQLNSTATIRAVKGLIVQVPVPGQERPSGPKALAYFVSSLVTKKNCFIGFPLGVNVIKHFFYVADKEAK